MLDTLAALLVGTGITFLSSLLLTNSVESLDSRTKLGSTFVGAIVTPLFTSLPEMIVFFTAILFYSGFEGDKIGIGTLFGQPFVTSSLSYGLLGSSIIMGMLRRKRQNTSVNIDMNLSVPYIFVSILFPTLYIPSLLVSYHIQILFAAIFAISYFLFVYLSYQKRIIGAIRPEIEPYLIKFMNPLLAIIVQIILTSIGLYIGTHLLVESLITISTVLGIDPLGLSIIVVPLATAIPETLNAMIWGYKGNDSLAISALVGEKVLYSTFYPALGLLSIKWTSNIYSELSIIFTTAVSFMMLIYIRSRHIPIYVMFIGSSFFILYAWLIFAYF